MVGLFIALLYIVFVLSAALLIIVILLQEPKGGGLAEAFGGVGAETFGVRERGINKFTATLAGVFIGSAVFLHILSRGRTEDTLFGPEPPRQEAPLGGAPALPGGPGGQAGTGEPPATGGAPGGTPAPPTGGEGTGGGAGESKPPGGG